MHTFRLFSALIILFVWSSWDADSFGFHHCILSPTKPGLAICAGRAVSNLSLAIGCLPNSTLWLNASHNIVSELVPTTFSNLFRLLELYLDHNHISSIEPNVFQILGDLEVLDLSWNHLASISLSMLASMMNLRKLFLGHNRIVALHSSSPMSLVALQELHLSYNNLSSLEEIVTAIKDLHNLTFLNLDSNQISTTCMGSHWIILPVLRNLSLSSNRISRLDLSNCSFPKLQQLNVTYNNMSEVVARSFLSTPNLVELSLDMNPLNISQLTNVTLPNLTRLHLSSMHPALHESFPVACSIFQELPSLTSLDIKNSKLNISQLKELGSCTNLTWLDLSTTESKFLADGVFSSFQNLEFLSLDKCKIMNLRPNAWGRQRYLHTLILRRNAISRLEDRVFQALIRLKYLDLSKNHLTDLHQQSFRGMESLRTLIMQGCQITAVTRATFQYARKMEFLDLSDNSMKRLKNYAFQLKHVKTLLLSGNKILSIQRNAFHELNSLEYLSLDHNLLYKLSNGVFARLKKLITLDLSHNQLLTYNKYDYPSPFAGLYSLRKLDLSFQMPQQPICPPDKLFEGLENLQYLSLRGNPSIVFLNLSFVNLTGLKSLDLSEINPGKAEVWNLSSNFFQGLRNLSQLWIESSALRDLPEQIFTGLGSLEELSLGKNYLKNFSKNTLGGVSSLKYLDVSEDPLTCFCENAWFQNWSVSEPNIQVAWLSSFHCFGLGVTDSLFVDVDMSFCSDTRGMYFFIVTTVTIVSLLFTNLIYTKFGWTFRHGYYLLRGWGNRELCKKGQDFQYDAYVSCCSKDYEWVVNNIIENLENQGEPSFQLCFGPRDFDPGEYYINNVQNGVSQSRKTLCVVSNNYLESEWCSLEIQLACSKIYYHGQDPLIVIFMEEIPNYRLSPYHRLRKLIKQDSYLTWPEDPEAENLFWTKLREALSCGTPEQAYLNFDVTD